MSSQTKIFVISLFALLSGLTLIGNLDFKINSFETERRLSQLDYEGRVGIEYFEKGIERFALLSSSIRAHVNSSDNVPSAEEIQDYLGEQLEIIGFNDSILVSYLDTNHIFQFITSVTTTISHDLIGTSVKDLRPPEEIALIDKFIRSDSLLIMPPINLVEGWVGLPFVFGVKRDDITIGYYSAILNLKSIMDEVYSSGKSDDFAYRFVVDDSLEFDRYAIYNNSTIFHNTKDSKSYLQFEIPEEEFINYRINSFGQSFQIGIAYKERPTINGYRLIFIASWLLLLLFIILTINIQARKNITLRKKNNELEDYNKILKDFTFASSHDLKEPLRNIGTFSALLRKRYMKYLDSDAIKYFDFIINGAKKMHQLLDDLLAYSKLVHETDLDKTDVDVNKVVQDVGQNLKTTIDQKQVVFKVGKLPIIYSNQSQIYQLFQNIISNAIKYNDKSVPVVEIGCEKYQNKNIFHVKDNGIGIDENYQEKIFVAFQRLYKNEYPGTGVGLAICKKIIELNKGRIWFQSKKGEGTTFYMEIPAEQN